MSTKNRIIEIVGEMINDKMQVDSISMSTVAEKAGIGKSTIYEYFSSKEDMIMQSVYDLAEKYVKELTDFELKDLDFKTAFIKQVSILGNMSSNKKNSLDLLINNVSFCFESNQDFKSIIQKYTAILKDRFVEILAIGVNEGVITITNTKKQGFLFKSLLTGALCCLVENDDVSVEEFSQMMYEQSLCILN